MPEPSSARGAHHPSGCASSACAAAERWSQRDAPAEALATAGRGTCEQSVVTFTNACDVALQASTAVMSTTYVPGKSGVRIAATEAASAVVVIASSSKAARRRSMARYGVVVASTSLGDPLRAGSTRM